MKIPTKDWILYTAGLLEGEGSFQLVHNAKYTRISITMNDKDVLDNIRDLWDAGKVYGPYIRNPIKYPNCQPSYRWQVYRKEEVYLLCVLVKEFMGIRRNKQITKVLDWYLAHKETVCL